MPKLDIKVLRPTTTKPATVARVQRALGVGATSNDVAALGISVRRWFKEDPSKRDAFIEWYEAQP